MPHEIDGSQLVFRPSAYAVVINNGKVLLSKQYGQYGFPGGGVEINETIENAVIREVKEETGLEVNVDEIVCCASNFFQAPSGKNWHAILLYYKCSVVGGSLTLDNIDEDEIGYIDHPEWIGLAELGKLKFLETQVPIMEIINKVINNKEKIC